MGTCIWRDAGQPGCWSETRVVVEGASTAKTLPAKQSGPTRPQTCDHVGVVDRVQPECLEKSHDHCPTYSHARTFGPGAWSRSNVVASMATNCVEVPVWDGHLETLPQFEEDYLDCVNSTKEEDRYVCSSREKRANDKKAPTSAYQGFLEQGHGVESFLENKLGAKPHKDAGGYLVKWIFTRDNEHDDDVVRAFNADYFVKEKKETNTRTRPSSERILVTD